MHAPKGRRTGCSSLRPRGFLLSICGSASTSKPSERLFLITYTNCFGRDHTGSAQSAIEAVVIKVVKRLVDTQQSCGILIIHSDANSVIRFCLEERAAYDFVWKSRLWSRLSPVNYTDPANRRDNSLWRPVFVPADKLEKLGHTAKEIVTVLRQMEMSMANGKTTPQAYREREVAALRPS
jgi:hypothetical protein